MNLYKNALLRPIIFLQDISCFISFLTISPERHYYPYYPPIYTQTITHEFTEYPCRQISDNMYTPGRKL